VRCFADAEKHSIKQQNADFLGSGVGLRRPTGYPPVLQTSGNEGGGGEFEKLGVGLEKEARKNTTERGVHGVSAGAFWGLRKKKSSDPFFQSAGCGKLVMLKDWFAADELRRRDDEIGELQKETNRDRYRILSD
jgi:hypothetical protein